MSSNKYQNALDMINVNINPDIAQKGSIGSFRAGKNDIYGKCLEAFNKNVEPDITAHEHITSRLYENAYIEGTWPVTLEDSSIDILGAYAFNGCTALTSLYFTGSSVPSIASNSFNNIPSTATFYVASSMVDAFKSASYWSAFASQIVAYTE